MSDSTLVYTCFGIEVPSPSLLIQLYCPARGPDTGENDLFEPNKSFFSQFLARGPETEKNDLFEGSPVGGINHAAKYLATGFFYQDAICYWGLPRY